MHPRAYLSYSSMILFESSPKAWMEYYVEGKPRRTNRAMALGKEIAEALKNGEETGDLVKDLIISNLPKFELMDHEWKAKVKIGKDEITIHIQPDSAREDLSAFKEYKTGRDEWNQKLVDESDQITFYATGAYLLKGKIPSDIELVWAPTEYDELDRPHLTGDIHRFPTKRTLPQIMRMQVRMMRNWKKMVAMIEEDLL